VEAVKEDGDKLKKLTSKLGKAHKKIAKLEDIIRVQQERIEFLQRRITPQGTYKKEE
jgi:hypothetical protein